MYTGVADKLEDQVQMDDYQREILEKALTFYERFAMPQSRDPSVRLEAARAALRVGAIRHRLGNTTTAEKADQQTIAILSARSESPHRGGLSRHPGPGASRAGPRTPRRMRGDRGRDGEIKETEASGKPSRRDKPDVSPSTGRNSPMLTASWPTSTAETQNGLRKPKRNSPSP